MIKRKTSIFEYYKNKKYYFSPFANQIANLVELTESLSLIDFHTFCCILDKNKQDINIVDNYEGVYRTIFESFNNVYLLTSSMILIFNENKIVKRQLFEYYYYEIYKSFIIFYCNNIFSICIYDIEKQCYIKYITTYNNNYKTIVYEDYSLNNLLIYVIYYQYNLIHFDIYDIIKHTNVNFDIKCKIQLRSIDLLSKNCFVCDFGHSTQIIDLNEKNKLYLSFLNPIIEESKYLYGIHSTYIKTKDDFFIIHNTYVNQIKTLNFNKIKLMIDQDKFEHCMYFSYDTCEPYINFVHDSVFYISNNSLFVSTLNKDFNIIIISNNIEQYNISSIKHCNNTLYCFTSYGDYITFSV